MACKETQEEYRRRNLVAAKTMGVRSGIRAVLKRMEGNSSSPKWAKEILKREMAKMDDIIQEVEAHRDEIHDKAWDKSF